MSREYLNALWELTKRELRRKYARSYLGIMWSVFYPLMRMILVVFLFSHVFNKGIDKYPLYYFTAYLLYEFFGVSLQTSLTTLKDNKDLIQKTKLPREIFVESRVLTACVNMLLGFIPYIFILIYYRIHFNMFSMLFLVVLFFLILYVLGLSYYMSIWFVYMKDSKNILDQLLIIIRYFVTMFYSIEIVSERVRYFIEINPIYCFIKISRDLLMYGCISEKRFWIEIFIVSILVYLSGRAFFDIKKDDVLVRL